MKKSQSSLGIFRSVVVTSWAALSVGACGGSQPPAPTAPPAAPTVSAAPAPAPTTAMSAAPAPAPTVAAAPAAEPKHEHNFHHPVIGMLMHEVTEVGLRPEQQTAIDGLKADLEKQTDASKAERAQLVADIADGVAAGKLDKTKIDADVKKLQQAADTTTKAIQDSVNKLHQTLDATQRKKLVDLMQAKAEEMHEHMMGPKHDHGQGEHAMEHKGPGGEAGKGPHGEHGMGPMDPHERLEKLSEALGLSADQKDKLRTKLDGLAKAQMAAMKEQHAAMQKRMKAIGEAFVTDKFDAKRAGVADKLGDMIKMMTKGRIDFVEAILSVLTPEQRSKFAEHLRQHSENDED